MISVIQRVSAGKVEVGGRVVGEIGRGLVVLTAVHVGDTEEDLRRTAEKLVTLRVFPNGEKAYDLDVTQVDGGGVLLVSNFTVAADLSGGRRPGLHPAAGPGEARGMFEKLVGMVRAKVPGVQVGEFGAEMRVSIENDGPLTVVFDTRAGKGARS